MESGDHRSYHSCDGVTSMMNTTADQLHILAYCCEHCAYAAADLAGGLRLQYPPAIKIVQLPCTGRLDVLTVLRAMEDGADGVMVAG